MRRLFMYHCSFCKTEQERLTDGASKIECQACGMKADKIITGTALKTNSANKFKPS